MKIKTRNFWSLAENLDTMLILNGVYMILQNGAEIMERKLKQYGKLIMMQRTFCTFAYSHDSYLYLLNNNIIGVLPAFIIMLIVFGIVLCVLLVLYWSVVRSLQGLR